MERYTPIPPIAEDKETAELDEDFQLSDKKYEEVKPVMKKRLSALSKLKTFDDQVRNMHFTS